MSVPTILFLCFAVVFLVFGVFVSKGKGLLLVAGYNTLSPQERERADKARISWGVSRGGYILAALFLAAAVSVHLTRDYDRASLFCALILVGLAMATIVWMSVMANTRPKRTPRARAVSFLCFLVGEPLLLMGATMALIK
jgi:hypothetical protein